MKDQIETRFCTVCAKEYEVPWEQSEQVDHTLCNRCWFDKMNCPQAEWDELAKEMEGDQKMIMYEVTGSPPLEDQVVFHQGISAQRLKYLKEAAKVMKALVYGKYSSSVEGYQANQVETKKKAKEFIDACGDDDE